MQLNNFPPGVAAVGGGPHAYPEYVTAVQTSGSSSAGNYTFNSVDIGSSANGKFVVLGFASAANGATVNAITVGGKFTTKVAEQAGTKLASLWIVDASTLTSTEDVVVNMTLDGIRATLGVWRLIANSMLARYTAASSDTDAQGDDTLTIPSKGCMIGLAVTDGNSGITSTGFTTENFDTEIGNEDDRVCGGYYRGTNIAYEADRAFSFSITGGYGGWALASFR